MIKKVCCGKEYGMEQAFCGVCGKQLEAKSVCGRCGAEITTEAKFCGSCGEPMKSEIPNTSNPPVPPVAHAHVQAKTTTRKNKTIGMIAVVLIVVILLITFVYPIFNKPIVGKWNMELSPDTYAPEVYIEFRGNGTFTINSLGVIEKGNFKIVKNGDLGKISIIPEDVKQSSYETDYKIEGDILTIGDMRYKKAK